MPTINDFEELDLTGLNIDHVAPMRAILMADYGNGYRDTIRVGPRGGTRQFAVSAGVWPDDPDDCPPIDGMSWMEYYTTFFDTRLDNANEPFVIEWRSKKWLVDFAEPQYGVEVHTSTLFTPDGVTFNLRRVPNMTFNDDGSIAYTPPVLMPLDGANIYLSGNSLTLGYPDHAPWDYGSQMAPLMTADGIVGFDITNIGHDSAETNALASYATTELYPFDDATRRNIAIIQEIGNDIYNNGDAAAAVTNFTNWYDDVVADGWEVLVLNLEHRGTVSSANTPFGDTEAQYQTKLATARAALTSWATTNNVPIVELMDDARLSDCTNATYYTDRVHLTHAGYLAKAEMVYEGLQAMAYTDTLVPVISSLTVEDANPDEILITYREHLDESSVPATGDFAASGGRTVAGVTVVDNVVTVAVNTPYAFGDTITVSYTPGTNKIKDLSGNLAAALTTEAVANNVSPVLVNIVPDLSSSTVTFFDISESPTGTWVAGAAGVWNHWAQCLQKLPASVDGYIEIEPGVGSSALGFMDADNAGNYTVLDYGGFISGGTFWDIKTGGAVTDTGVAYAAGDKLRLKRTSGTLTLVRSRAGVETVCTTFTGTHNGVLFIGFVLTSTSDTFILPKGIAVVNK